MPHSRIVEHLDFPFRLNRRKSKIKEKGRKRGKEKEGGKRGRSGGQSLHPLHILVVSSQPHIITDGRRKGRGRKREKKGRRRGGGEEHQATATNEWHLQWVNNTKFYVFLVAQNGVRGGERKKRGGG